MDREQRRKYIAMGVLVFCVVAACVLFIFAIFKFEIIKAFFVMVWRILMPFIYGFVLAYLLLPVYNALYTLLEKLLLKKKRSEKSAKRRRILANALAVTCTMVAFISLLIGFGFLVLPELVRSITSIIMSVPETGRKIIAWAEQILQDNPEIEKTVTEILSRYIGDINTWAENYLLPYVTEIVNGLSSGIVVTVTGTFTFVKNVVIGLVVAIYMLISKGRFSAQAKKLVYSCLNVKTANYFLENVRLVHRTFGGFISGKLLDALMMGILCYIGMSIFGFPYAVLISVTIGVTNIIPFFGPFIGAIPSALLILTVSPIQCLYFVLFIVILQQIDGNLIEPRILGESVGISSFWVMFSILFFSGFFGFVGMVIGVPLCALLLSLIAALCQRSLVKKGLPIDSADYADAKAFDAESKRKVLLPPKLRMRDNPNGKLRRFLNKFKRKRK